MLFHTEVRWLSRENVVSSVVSQKDEITNSLTASARSSLENSSKIFRTKVSLEAGMLGKHRFPPEIA